MSDMTAERAAFILDCHNRWRRGDDDYAETNPKVLGEAIEFAIQALTAPRVPEGWAIKRSERGDPAKPHRLAAAFVNHAGIPLVADPGE